MSMQVTKRAKEMIKYATLLLSDSLTRFAEKAGQRFNIGYILISVFDEYDGPASRDGSKAIDHTKGEWLQGSVFINSTKSYPDGEQFWVAYQIKNVTTEVSKKEAIEWVEGNASDKPYDDPLTVRILKAHHQTLEELDAWSQRVRDKARSLGISFTQLHVLYEIAEGGCQVRMTNGLWNPIGSSFHGIVTKRTLNDMESKGVLSTSEDCFILERALSDDIQAFFVENEMPLIYRWQKYAR